jgi:hypothetical protein
MPDFQVVFHVAEKDVAGAEEWRRRASLILEQYKPELVSKGVTSNSQNQNVSIGSFCGGHVLNMDGSDPIKVDPPLEPSSKVLHMGPRE